MELFLLLGHRLSVLLFAHPDGSQPTTMEELADGRLVAGEQHLPRPEHDQHFPEQHAPLTGYCTPSESLGLSSQSLVLFGADGGAKCGMRSSPAGISQSLICW